jgi:endonuclease/exonuclease/phosphatase family metal-dependent hydrolase
MTSLALAVLLALTGGTRADAADPLRRLRILSYNIHHGEGTDGKIDLPRLAKVIQSARPDLVAVQEVDNKARRSGGVDQTAELARLTGLHGAFCKQLDYDGGEYGQAILSRFPIKSLTVHWLPGVPDRQRRIAGEARVDIEGKGVSFVTTHLHHFDAKFRRQQAEKLNELFGNVDRPVILAGDLNATPESPPIRALSRAWTLGTSNPDLKSGPSQNPWSKIDYILFRPAGTYRASDEAVIDEAVASDHRPVFVVLEAR